MYRSGPYISFFLQRFISILAICFIVETGGSTALYAQGNLLVMPRRVIFESSLRSQELNLANTGNDTAHYSISIIDIRMKEDGNFETISEPDSGQHFAGSYLRLFPRSVTLAPGESQVVKLQLSKSAGMAAGEYRSHLYFRALPEEKPLGTPMPVTDSSLSIRLVPVFGISIPVIIRVGETSAEVSFSGLSFNLLHDSIPLLSLAFERKGNCSVYGDLLVNFVSPQGRTVQVAAVKGLAVYTPNTSRQLQINLDNNRNINYHTGQLKLVYTAPAEYRYAKLAEAVLPLH